jgi:hypothetical protein
MTKGRVDNCLKHLQVDGCFLQVLFPESCKIFFHSIATGISTMLQTVFC